MLPTDADKLTSPIFKLAHREAIGDEGTLILAAEDIVDDSATLSAAAADSSCGTREAAAGGGGCGGASSSSEASSLSASTDVMGASHPTSITSPFARALFSALDAEERALGGSEGIAKTGREVNSGPAQKRPRSMTGALVDVVVAHSTGEEVLQTAQSMALGPAVSASQVDGRFRHGALAGGDRKALLLHRETAPNTLRAQAAKVEEHYASRMLYIEQYLRARLGSEEADKVMGDSLQFADQSSDDQ